MEFTADELKSLRDSLPRGSAKKIAEKLNMSPGTIRNILSGQAKNNEVLVAAVELAKNVKHQIGSAKADIASL